MKKGIVTVTHEFWCALPGEDVDCIALHPAFLFIFFITQNICDTITLCHKFYTENTDQKSGVK